MSTSDLYPWKFHIIIIIICNMQNMFHAEFFVVDHYIKILHAQPQRFFIYSKPKC